MKYIQFNGKNICYKRINGEYWIVVKSVCEALNVEYTRQFKNLQKDPILGAALAKQPMQLPGENQKRDCVCLPEVYVYGWIFQIRSASKELLEYKKKCYLVLYRHFHGIITRRAELYSEITKTKNIICDFETKLAKIEGYEDYQEAKMRNARLWKQVRDTTSDADLFDNEDFSGK
jgi:hypothetical protein